MASKWYNRQLKLKAEERMAKEQELFDKYTPKWMQWLMRHSIRFTRYLKTEIGCVDNNPNKMIITRRGKMIGKSF
jgi:hypothetical protein